jgi:hypothetical protein
LCTTVGQEGVKDRAMFVFTSAKDKLKFKFGRNALPYMVAAVMVAARESNRDLNADDFMVSLSVLCPSTLSRS